jgi:thiamine biosynthesis lipoprotein
MMEQPGDAVRYPSRRAFLSLGVSAFVVAAIPWGTRRRPLLTRRTIPIMGTSAEVAVVHRDEAYAQAAIDAAFAEMRGVERTMSRFRPESDIGRANLAAADTPVLISSATAQVVARSLEWARATEGRFDPALGGAVALWDVGHRTEPPAPGELRRYAGERLYREVELGWSGGSDVVLFRSPAVALDLGGIAKGYAVDRAVAALRTWGIGGALVNAGGDLYALGRSPDGDPWEIGIRSPDAADGIAATVHAQDEAIATSGDYEQFFEYRGRRYHHLLDPATAAPYRVATRSLTIAAADCMTADAAATALFGATPAQATSLPGGLPTPRIVHST